MLTNGSHISILFSIQSYTMKFILPITAVLLSLLTATTAQRSMAKLDMLRSVSKQNQGRAQNRGTDLMSGGEEDTFLLLKNGSDASSLIDANYKGLRGGARRLKNSEKSEKSDKSEKSEKSKELDPACFVSFQQGPKYAPVPTEGCEDFHHALIDLRNQGNLSDSQFQLMFEVLKQAIDDFVKIGTPSDILDSMDIDYDNVRNRLEQFIREDATLSSSDFTELMNNLADFTTPVRIGSISSSGLSFDIDKEVESVMQDSSALTATPSINGSRNLGTFNWSDECTDAVIRLGLNLLGLSLAFIGVRGAARRPFMRYMAQAKGGAIKGLVLEAWTQGQGNFDVSFFVSITVGILGLITWDDIYNSFAEMGRWDAFNLAASILIAIGAVVATNGAALLFAYASLAMELANLVNIAIEINEKCWKLCDALKRTVGYQGTYTYDKKVYGSGEGNLILFYNMYDIKDKLELTQEKDGKITQVYSTNGHVAGELRKTFHIKAENGDLKLKIDAPTQRTVWVAKFSCDNDPQL